MTRLELRSAELQPHVPLVELYRRTLGVGAPPGECRLTRRGDRLVIERADEHIWVDDDFLAQVVKNANPWVTLTYQPFDLCDPGNCCQRWRGGHCYYGAILTIRGLNTHVMYRVGRYLRGGVWDAYHA